MTDTNLFAQQRANRRRSQFLVAVFLGFFAWVGFGGDLALFLHTAGLEDAGYRHVVEEMAIASGLPKPTVWIVPDPDPNAFATGLDERSAHDAVTEGLLTILNRDQLQGVIAHEMAHIRNHDVKLMTLLAALVGTIALISDSAWRVLRLGGHAHRGGRGGKRGGAGRGSSPWSFWSGGS